MVYKGIATYPDFEAGLVRIIRRIKQAGGWLETAAADVFDWITVGSTEPEGNADEEIRRREEGSRFCLQLDAVLSRRFKWERESWRPSSLPWVGRWW